MGRIKTKRMKNLGEEVYGKFSDKFSDNFVKNKQVMSQVVGMQSKKIQNIIAGYITRKVKNIRD